MRPTRIIALEEHFTTRDFPQAPLPALYELGERRIEEMNRFGIDVQVLSLGPPGIQGEANASSAADKAYRTNDTTAEIVRQFPSRFAAFACLPTQEPPLAARELERAVTQLGCKGALINGHTQGHYLDERQFDPIWERAEALDVPVYLHPTMAYQPWHVVSGYPELSMAAWGWSAETGAHALRLILGGVFDRFPAVKVILGHMGETIPFYLSRIDSRLRDKIAKRGLRRPEPATYIRDNFLITTSGVFDNAPLLCTIQSMGLSSIMFSVDYPYESNQNASQWLDQIPLPQEQVDAIAHSNAERLLRL